jgi:hypothetical protein
MCSISGIASRDPQRAVESRLVTQMAALWIQIWQQLFLRGRNLAGFA